MERGIVICLKKSGEQGYRIQVSDGDICNFGPGVECHIRFGMRQGKGVFCSISADEEGPVQLKKISECSVFVNEAQVEYETYLNYGDLFEIEGRKFIWESSSYEDSSLSGVEEKKSPVKRISSTTQIHGRKSINEFRASKKLYKSTNTSRFWAESDENVLTDSKNQNAGFSVSTSPIRLTYLQNSPQKKSENYSFKVKLKNSTPKRASVRTPKLRTPISENKTESVRKTPKSANITPKSARKTPKSAIITPKSARITPKSARSTPKSARSTPKSTRKTPKSTRKTPKSARKTPKSAIITPKSVVKTPKSAIKTPKSAFKDEKLLIKTPRSTAKTPNSTIQTRKCALRTPKSTVMASTVLVKTPRLLRSEMKSSSSSKLLQLNKLQRKQSETGKYFENNISMQLPTKIPRKYFFTPPTRTPRSNIRKIEGKAASVSIKAQKIKSPILAEKQSPVQNRSPKNVISLNTPKSLQKLISSTPKSTRKGSKQDKTSASSVKSPEEILKTPRSTRQRTLEAAKDLESEVEIKPTDNINRSLQSSVLSAKSSPIFLPAVSPNSGKAARKSRRVSFSAAKSSVRKFAGTKRKRSGSDSFQRSLKRKHLEPYIGSDSEKENTGSASSLSIINSSMNLSEAQETNRLFNSFVNLEKNDFTNQDISLPSKALTGPKHSLRNTRRLSAPGRFVRLLNMDSNTSTPKKLRSDTELLEKVFGENTPIVSINVNYNTNITYTENSERPSTSMASGNLSGINRLTRNSDLISFNSPRISISELPNFQNKDSEQNAINIVHDSHEGSPVVQLNISSQRSLIENLPSPKELLQIEGNPLNKSKSKSDVEQMTLRNSSLKVKNISSVNQVLSLVKSPNNDLTNIRGIKKLFSTPKLRHSPRNDLSDVKGVRQLMKTPGRVPKSPKNDLTNVEGVRALMRTPKSPKNDLTNVSGVKRIMSKSPRNDLSSVKGLKKLLKTPQRAAKSPKNDLTDVRGVKQLIRTPKPNPKSPRNDLTEIKGVKNLMRTPKSPKNDLSSVYGVKRILAKSPENDLTDVRGVRNLFRSIKLKRSPRFTVSGVKKLMKSPAKQQKSPKNDLTDVTGVKNILRSPKSPPDILQNVSGIKRLVSREPSNRLSDLRGVKNILRTPKAGNSPNDLQDTEGVNKLMQTPKPKAREPKNDLRDVEGVKQLFNHSEPRNSLSDVNGLENLFTETNSPQKSSPRKQKQSSTNTPAKVQNETNPVLNESPSYNINNMDVLFDKLRDESESSIDDAIEKLILFTPKHTYERKGKSFTPTKTEASKNTRGSLGALRENAADVQKWVEEQKLYLKAHSEQDEQVPKEKTKVTRKRKAVEENVDVTTTRTRTRRDKQINTNETEKSVTPRKRTRRQGNDEEDPIITSTRSQRSKQKELTDDENATPQTSKLTNKRTRRNNAESTPVTESTDKSTRQKVKKAEPESKPSTPAPEILEKARGTRRGKKQEVTEVNEEKEKPSQTRGKRKLGTSNDLENSEEQTESTNKKTKSKSMKSSKTKHEDETTESEEQTKKSITRTRSKRVNNEKIEETTELPEKLNDSDVEKQKPVLKKITRNKAKNTSKDEQPEIITKTRSQAKNPKIKTNSEDSKHIEEPTTKNTRSKNKTEKDDQKENEEPEKNTRKTTRRQVKESESINKNEQKEEIKVPNTRTTRKRGAITEEQANNEPEEKRTRSKKISASKKNEQKKEEETKSTEHKMSTKKSIQETKQEVTEPRRSARTRKAKK